MMNPKEAWDQWVEAWYRVAETGGDPVGLSTRWLEMMEETRARLQAEGNLPRDPFTFFKQWYDLTSEVWAKMVGDIIGTEQFMEESRHFLENYTSSARLFRRTNEEFFRNLQLSTRSDTARIGEFIIALEEKVDRLEDTFENFEGIHALEKRLALVESKLDSILAVVEKINTNDQRAQRTTRS